MLPQEVAATMAFRQCLGVLASLVPLIGCPSPNPSLGSELRLLSVSEVEASTRTGVRYYVAPGGSDESPGTALQPFRTIQKGADLAGPGDTVFVLPGTYTGGARIVSLSRPGMPE